MVPLRVQFQKIGSQVDFIKEESKILINIIGVMDKKRYTEKKNKYNLFPEEIILQTIYHLLFSDHKIVTVTLEHTSEQRYKHNIKKTRFQINRKQIFISFFSQCHHNFII